MDKTSRKVPESTVFLGLVRFQASGVSEAVSIAYVDRKQRAPWGPNTSLVSLYREVQGLACTKQPAVLCRPSSSSRG
ncbi:hypothetical protein D3C85_1085880 [compost metagenome]|jgi:hypothetical protein